MRNLIILVDESSQFLVSKADFRNFTSMDVARIRKWFVNHDYNVMVCRFSELDMTASYSEQYVLYQTSEAPGGFYKRYIEDLVYILEEQGAVVLPSFKYLKAHHDKVFMEFLRMGFRDEALKTIKSSCYGSWVDALNYKGEFPVVIKQASGSAGKRVYLAYKRNDYEHSIRKAGKTIVAENLVDLLITKFKNFIKKIIKILYPSKRNYIQYNTDPVSNPIVVQNFISGFEGDYRVLFFGGRYYCMHRANRKNDFRASGSGQFSDVGEDYIEGLLDFARRLTMEIDFPIVGMDIGFDGHNYHLIEYQMINFGTSALQRSSAWHEYQNGEWIKLQGKSILEDEFARSIEMYINSLNR
ncbi:MAG: hypothetical protein KA807_07885 [Prolixibacteraceae bacterium]|nr:hypothetical protein [Prolixibacteraceae bacterium]